MFVVWFCGRFGWFTHEYDTHEDGVAAAYDVNQIGCVIADGPVIQSFLQERVYD